MSVIFKFDGKTIKNEQIENISLLIKLGDKFKNNDSYENEEYVANILNKKCNIFKLDQFAIECPYADLVYLNNQSFSGESEVGLYPNTIEELQLLIDSYHEITKVFDKDKVRVSVYSNYLYDEGNEDDFALEEFLNSFKLVEE